MAYLDSAGNVSDLTVQQWQYFHRAQAVLPQKGQVQPAAPTTALPAGGEKAERGHD